MISDYILGTPEVPYRSMQFSRNSSSRNLVIRIFGTIATACLLASEQSTHSTNSSQTIQIRTECHCPINKSISRTRM